MNSLLEATVRISRKVMSSPAILGTVLTLGLVSVLVSEQIDDTRDTG